jgi:MFS family permease
LDFQSTSIPRVRLLRHYNVSWTGGTAAGMYAGGLLCEHGWVFETFVLGAICAGMVFLIAAVTREAHAPKVEPFSLFSKNAPAAGRQNSHVALTMLIAAALFNLCAIGTKIIISANYAELNQKLGQDSGRWGLLIATGTLAQLAAFGVSKWFEPWLGLRRVYLAGAVTLVAVNLAFSRLTFLPVLLVAEAALGFALAVSFQCSILAFIARSATPRHGTTLFETTIGLSGLAALAAGKLSQYLKDSGTNTLEALRAPFYAAMAFIALALAVQWFLVPADRARRHLACDA